MRLWRALAQIIPVDTSAFPSRHPERSRRIYSAVAGNGKVFDEGSVRCERSPRGRVAAASMLTAIENGSFDFAQDDSMVRLSCQQAYLGLLLVMHLRCISIRPYRVTLLQGSTHVRLA